jgi:hypothetical protein
VTSHGRNRARSPARLARGLLVAGALGVAGCGDPEQGTAKVAPEARERLLPQAGPKAVGGQPQSAAGKTFSIKDRAPKAASP